MAKRNEGTVYLVGAGPGDPDLITVRGRRLLDECDAVVYDYLVPDELIVTLPDSIERHYVGKRGGKQSFSQQEINDLAVTLAREGKTVVRLKGADPLVFGRGGEEARYLKDNNVRFEIVPGVTAGVGATAYAGIPCTDRTTASWVMFATGHKAADKAVDSIDWNWVGRGVNGTLVIYMGVSEIPNLVAQLLSAGKSPDTPAAAIERGTTPTQRVITTTLKDLPSKVATEKISAPSLFVIGEVVSLREYMEWFCDKPLLGVRILVTRPAHQAKDMYRQLRDLGAEVMPYPTIAIRGQRDEDAWARFDDCKSDNAWLIFTSENGVNNFYQQLIERGHDIRSLGRFKVAAIGAGTARALAAMHLQPDFVPTIATSAALTEQFVKAVDVATATVVRVRGTLSIDNIDNAISDGGGTLIPLTVYETATAEWSEHLRQKLAEFPPDVVTFTSGSTGNGLIEILTADELQRYIKPARIVSIGPSTSDTIRDHGLEVAIEVSVHSVPGVIEAIVDYARENELRRK